MDRVDYHALYKVGLWPILSLFRLREAKEAAMGVDLLAFTNWGRPD
jgi:hypothetical protein